MCMFCASGYVHCFCVAYANQLSKYAYNHNSNVVYKCFTIVEMILMSKNPEGNASIL